MPDDALDNLIQRISRATFDPTSFRNHRIRSLPHVGKPRLEPAGQRHSPGIPRSRYAAECR
jgi:hypothetical protein